MKLWRSPRLLLTVLHDECWQVKGRIRDAQCTFVWCMTVLQSDHPEGVRQGQELHDTCLACLWEGRQLAGGSPSPPAAAVAGAGQWPAQQELAAAVAGAGQWAAQQRVAAAVAGAGQWAAHHGVAAAVSDGPWCGPASCR